MKKELEVGQPCFVRRPNASFSGVVLELYDGWVRVAGRGDHEFDEGHRCSRLEEFFPIDSRMVSVVAV